jgi:hypothetical protein
MSRGLRVPEVITTRRYFVTTGFIASEASRQLHHRTIRGVNFIVKFEVIDFCRSRLNFEYLTVFSLVVRNIRPQLHDWIDNCWCSFIVWFHYDNKTFVVSSQQRCKITHDSYDTNTP